MPNVSETVEFPNRWSLPATLGFAALTANLRFACTFQQLAQERHSHPTFGRQRGQIDVIEQLGQGAEIARLACEQPIQYGLIEFDSTRCGALAQSFPPAGFIQRAQLPLSARRQA